MPSETFLRLPEEKRTRFINAAWEEFLRVSFADASINKIVLRASIPRGSFYQYFVDKQELFFYLLGDMMKYLLTEYRKVLDKHDGDMFRTQVHCFDLVLLERKLDPQFARGMELLRRNPVFLMQQIVENQLACCIWETVKDAVDITVFRNEELAKQSFVMSLVTLVMTMTEAMAKPEQTDAYRQALLGRMDILKYGSLKACPKGESHE